MPRKNKRVPYAPPAASVIVLTPAWQRCATIGHGAVSATHVITWTDDTADVPEVVAEKVCTECAESYGRRPALADFTSQPVGRQLVTV